MTTAQRTTCFLLPPPVCLDDRTILVLMDGNERAKQMTPDGYKAGGKKLVELARHLCSSKRTTRLVACVLSRENIAKRDEAFFAELHQALVEFGAIVVAGGLGGVAMDIVGSLERLRAAGEHARACADAFEAITRATAHEESPALRLSLAVDYGRDVALTTDAFVIFRTGMPADGVVRTSGIDTANHQVCRGTKTLWPQLSMNEIDRVIDDAARGRLLSFAPGFEAAFLATFARSLASVGDRVDITVFSRSTGEETSQVLRGLFAVNASVERFLSVVHTLPDSDVSRWYGTDDGERHVLRIVHPAHVIASPAPNGFDIVLAAGQRHQALVLPTFPRLGYATVWPTGTSPLEIAQSIVLATRDFLENAPLLGAARKLDAMDDAGPRSSLSTVKNAERSFEERIVEWAETSNLFADVSECKGASNYIRTAYRLFSDEETRETVAKYMLLVAVGDILFDERLPGESLDAHKARLSVSTTYLRDSLSRPSRMPPPNVAGARILEAIAKQWSVMANQFAHRALDVLFRQWLRALDDHYEASVREWSPAVVDNDLVRDVQAAGNSRKLAAETILARYVSGAPAAVGIRIWELVQICLAQASTAPKAALELRVWLYLVDVNTIGAGLAFRSAALCVPPSRVTSEGIAAFGRTLPLLDYRIRLANDASEFVKTMGRDRDAGKTNSCSLLVPEGMTGVARAGAIMQALPLLRSIGRWLDAALNVELDDLMSVWPDMGQWISRGRTIGVTAYNEGHYTTHDHKSFTSLLEAS